MYLEKLKKCLAQNVFYIGCKKGDLCEIGNAI